MTRVLAETNGADAVIVVASFVLLGFMAWVKR